MLAFVVLVLIEISIYSCIIAFWL